MSSHAQTRTLFSLLRFLVMGSTPHVADKILNHSAGTIRGVALHLDERKAALEALGRFVQDLVRPTPTNVIPTRTSA